MYFLVRANQQILIVTGRLVLVVGGNVQFKTSLNGYILITWSVTGPDLWSFLCSLSGMFPSIVWHDALTVSSAIARGRPGMSLADWRALSITDWWYCHQCQLQFWNSFSRTYLIRAMREVHANDIEASWCSLAACDISAPFGLTFSEHCNLLCRIGLGTCILSVYLLEHGFVCPTDRADDTCSAIVLRGCIVDVEARMPLHLGAVIEMIQSVTHFDILIPVLLFLWFCM